MMQPSLIIGGSGGGNGPAFVRQRILQISGQDFIEFVSSTTTSKAALLSAVQADDSANAALQAAQIYYECLMLGGGGGGSAAAEAWGGMPGQTTIKTGWLDGLSDSDISLTIGAGGASDSQGGDTIIFGLLPTESFIGAAGGRTGGITPAEATAAWGSTSVRAGYSILDPSVTDLGPYDVTLLGNFNGPGVGGKLQGAQTHQGGTSMMSDPPASTFSGFADGDPGGDANPGVFRSVGAGGVAHATGTGGAGGAPGGGGGAGSVAGGIGGNGVVRFRFSVWERI